MSNLASNDAETGPFGHAALTLRQYGLAIIPFGGEDGKTPLVKWGNWKRPPGRDPLAKLAKQHPFSNIGVICHLSNVTVVDVDDPTLRDSIVLRCGDTPLITGTPSGGNHFWYRHNGERCANLRESDGIAVDIKGAGGFVVVPPSLRPNGPYAGTPYKFIAGSWEDLKRLPNLQSGALSHERENEGDFDPLKAVKTGRRNSFLFKLLLQQATACDDFDALLDVARSINEDFDPPLPDAEVVKTAGNAWGYEERGSNWAGREAQVVIPKSQLVVLIENPNALTLLATLKSEHGARKRPFAVSSKRMSAANVIPDWGPRRYTEARNWLEHREFLKVKHRGGKKPGDASLFTFG